MTVINYRQIPKGNMQKMNGKKIYKGNKYEFIKVDEHGRRGGNGGVYEVRVLNNKIEYEVVAKFFEYDRKPSIKSKRYDRFKQEIQVIQQYQNEIEGIIKIIDYYCPDEVPAEKDGAWYLMPKAQVFCVNTDKALKSKLENMLKLAKIIFQLHHRGLAHRDIKPDNILMLDNNIVLSDFGLVWSIEQDRMTDEQERIGPYKILPPELESIDLNLTLDFRPSDVFLFAKVLWMVLQNDNLGFRGQYNRRDSQIYLDSEKFGVTTLEPIHCLIEQATCNTIADRISIEKCIEFIELQISILNNYINEEKIKQLCYDEKSKELINSISSDKIVYVETSKIFNFIESMIDKCQVFVKRNTDMQENLKEIQVNGVSTFTDGRATLNLFIQGKKIKEYLIRPYKLTYINKTGNLNGSMSIELKDIQEYDNDFQEYGKAGKAFITVNKKEYISSDYIIILKKI